MIVVQDTFFWIFPEFGYGDYISIGINAVLYSSLSLAAVLNSLVFAWALEDKFDFISLQAVRNFFDILNEWSEVAMLLDIVAYPVNFIIEIFLAADSSETFNPTNEGFIIFFELIIFPILSMSLIWPSFINLFIMPALILVYIFNKELFVDQEASDAWEAENFELI